MVYPRTHGETHDKANEREAKLGLSPYTRGNLLPTELPGPHIRSIPVHTGKPSETLSPSTVNSVYPRTHGETVIINRHYQPPQGLSPYTRGNHPLTRQYHQRKWSIPVHTGKPIRPIPIRISCKVYPRTHGETHIGGLARRTLEGLSPYTRGNHSWYIRGTLRGGSIPVHTGKPSRGHSGGYWPRVYPRTHGETEGVNAKAWAVSGLSPYTRGNRVKGRELTLDEWSIPVHTGKP